MRGATRVVGAIAGCVLLLGATGAVAQDWPQWRGPNRDARAAGFHAPESWPQQLTQKWKVAVGDGVSTPALVGDKLYVFTRQDNDEVTRCLDAATGQEVWQDQYAAEGPSGPSSRFPGPRSSPVVADGKVVTLGVRGILSCLDAATGEVQWRKDDFEGSWPMFFAASSPMVVDGLCIAQVGGQGKGGIVAYDLGTGEEKWKWTGDSPAYASAVLLTVDGTKAIMAPMEKNLVALDAADGRLLWEIQYSQGRYNAATPIVDDQTVVFAGPGSGMTAMTIRKLGDDLSEEGLWRNTDNSVQFSTPVLKNGLVFGLSTSDRLFCIDAQTHETAWTAPIAAPAEEPQAGATQPAEGQARGGRGGGRGRGGRSSGGYGSVVDAGTVLLALTPAAELVVFQPSGQAFTELARYKVADTPTYAYPVAVGNRVYVKDQDSLTLWTVQ